MRRLYHPESGAFEFFPTPEDKMLESVDKDNKAIKSEISEIKALLKELTKSSAEILDARLNLLSSDQLKELCSLLGISTTATKESTLIEKIKSSGKTEEEILSALAKIKD